jgi:methylenetetrahydrofolate reductase (NADPH)
MRPLNPLRDALATGQFCHVVEIVASRMSREARLLEVASELARIRGVVAGSITSYAGGAPGHDPVRVATAARARGLTPNVHVTCVSRDRVQLVHLLEDLSALRLENVLALTGDFPQGSPAVFDVDSVQLVSLIHELRQRGHPFWISVAVSPFKYTEADCVYQYLKLEKKFNAGADCAITQVGFDIHKFRELRQYLQEREIKKPILGNVYVLSRKAAEKMAKGEPPGCWVSPQLCEKVQEESQAKDKGEAARLERAARMVAILRGLGYAGAYIGGTHKPEHIQWIVRRGEALASKWEEFADEMAYAPRSAFYFHETRMGASKPLGVIPRILNFLGRMVPVRDETPLRKMLERVLSGVDRYPTAARLLERAEFALKKPMFGCQACGNCVLGDLEYVCPQTCPKQLRNGPCGGTNNGQCEVFPEKACVWVAAYDRAKAVKEVEALKVYIPAPDRSLTGTSSWINYFLGRDRRPQKMRPIAEISPLKKVASN